MAELSYVLKQKYSNSFDTLKNTSFDSENEIYMCQSSMHVVNFDHLKESMSYNPTPASYDCLFVNEYLKTVYCVEFKNQDKSDVVNTNIQKKAEDSQKIIISICSKNNVSIGNYDLILCIVYSSNPSKYKYHRFRENIIRFGLEKYKGTYYKDVITNDIEFFKKEFEKKYDC